MMLSREIGIAALLAAGFAAPAAAAPAAHVAGIAVPGAGVVTVAYGCGRGFAPNAWGRCRPIYRRYGYVRRGYYGYGYGPRVYRGPGFSVGLPGARVSFY